MLVVFFKAVSFISVRVIQVGISAPVYHLTKNIAQFVGRFFQRWYYWIKPPWLVLRLVRFDFILFLQFITTTIAAVTTSVTVVVRYYPGIRSLKFAAEFIQGSLNNFH